MRVAGVQLDIVWEDPEENFRRAAPWIRRAADQGAQLVVLPEMFATGFSMNVQALREMAPSIRFFLASMARELGITLVGGVVEGTRGDGGTMGRNMAAVYGPDGSLLTEYQKIHPFSYGVEHRHYLPGDALTFFVASNLTVTPLVCYDLRFPEVFRVQAEITDLFVVIANWPAPRRFAWRSLLVARAIENQCYVLGVNSVGTFGGLTYSGDSLLIDPLGEIVASAPEAPGLVSGDVDVSHVGAVRSKYPFLKDRRPEVYKALQDVWTSTLCGQTRDGT